MPVSQPIAALGDTLPLVVALVLLGGAASVVGVRLPDALIAAGLWP